MAVAYSVTLFRNSILICHHSPSDHYLSNSWTHSTQIRYMDVTFKYTGWVWVWFHFDDFWQNYASWAFEKWKKNLFQLSNFWRNTYNYIAVSYLLKNATRIWIWFRSMFYWQSYALWTKENYVIFWDNNLNLGCLRVHL